MLLSSCPDLPLGFPLFGNQSIQEMWKEGPDLGLIWCSQLLIPMFRHSLRVSYHISLALEVRTMVNLTLRISGYRAVLVSTGTELTLFLVAGTVLGFGFSVRMILITR